MTQARLARAAAVAGRTRLTPAAISQFELGAVIPASQTLAALADALDVEPIFLTSAAADRESDLPAFFRSVRATPAGDRKRARNLTQLVHRLVQVLDETVGLPPRSLPDLPTDPFADPPARRAAAEEVAGAVRNAWKLDRGPIPNVVACLEEHGVVCTRLTFREARVDAFSVNFIDHPVVVLSADKDKWDRSRFDAAHELGHLVMHEEAAGVPEAEKQAHEFAAAFLMPARDIRRELPARADWGHLRAMKATWGVSIAALLMRARTLDVMPESAYVSATRIMSARGWRRHEPGDGTPELPKLLSDAMSRARLRGLSPAQLRTRAAIPADLFDDICTLIGG